MSALTATRPSVDVLHIAYGGLGGHAPVVNTLAKSLASRQLRSGVIAYAEKSALTENTGAWASIPIVYHVEMNGRIDLVAWKRVYQLVNSLRPRMAICHNHKFALPIWAAGRSIRRNRLRQLLVEHQAVDLRSLSDNVYSAISLPLVDAAVFLSTDYKNRYPLRRLPFRSIRGAAVIPNCVDINEFVPLPGPTSGTGFRIGMASRLTATKDLSTLIRALHELRRIDPSSAVHLEIAGSGPSLPELRTLVVALELELNVTFRGHVPSAHLGDFYRGLDAYVHSTDGETASTAILQAMATELPVIGSDVLGVNDLIQNDVTGLLVTPKNPGAMAQAISSLQHDDALRIRLGRAGRDIARTHFSVEATTAEYLNLFARIDPTGPWLMAGSDESHVRPIGHV